MYIQIGDSKHPCSNYRSSDGYAAFHGIPNLDLPIGGDIFLYSEDEFELAKQSVSDYARQIYKDGVLTLTNDPEPTLGELRSVKRAELSAATEAAIKSGVDVETAYGTEHFSLDDHDQTNITNLSMLVQSGVPGYLYHADGKACVMYLAADINKIAAAAWQHITYLTTYNNFLYQWVRREADPEIVQSITFGAELPADLAADMAALLAAISP